MAKIELIEYTDQVGRSTYYLYVNGGKVRDAETTNYAEALRWYNYAIMHNGETTYDVLKSESTVVEEIDEPVADETYDWDSPSFVAKVEEESKLWAEWSSRPNWAATQSFQDFVESKIGAEKDEYERTRNSEHSGSEGKRHTHGFSSSNRPGFTITFNNGWTVSVQWHNRAYCNRITPREEFDQEKEYEIPARAFDAEIAAWNEKGDFHVFDNDDARGYVTPEELVSWLVHFKSL